MDQYKSLYCAILIDKKLQNSKLKKAVEQIQFLELKLQDVNNENAKLMVKQKEDSKLWKGLDSKLSSTKTLCNQLTETLQHLAGQTSAGKSFLVFLIRSFLFVSLTL